MFQLLLCFSVSLFYGPTELNLRVQGDSSKTFYDWFLIWEIAAVGITGLSAEVLRWIGIPSLGYIVYFCHLVSVMMLFLYLPYTKFAHIAYRTTAMSFEKYRESSFGKPAVE